MSVSVRQENGVGDGVQNSWASLGATRGMHTMVLNRLAVVTWIVLVGAGWLLITGRLQPLIEEFQQAGYPGDERRFIDTIQSAKHRWNDAANDIQREPVSAARNAALCNLPANVSNWKGSVKLVSTYPSSNSVSISVAVAPNITLGTEGDMEERGSKVARDTPMFESVSGLAAGQPITFSGRFLKGEGVCFDETSLTSDGSLTDPRFEFAFDSVRAR